MAFALTPRGPFSLAESAGFPFIDRESGSRTPDMRLAFCRDGTWEPTGVHLTERHGAVRGDGPPEVRDQIARILALDVDASTWPQVGERDPVMGRLQAAAPGLRPVLLPSAYEAAAWCVLAARRSGAQSRALRRRLAEHAGTVLDIAGEQAVCLPPPDALVDPPPLPGLDDVRRERLGGVARAALEGRLDTEALRALPPDTARAQLEELPGIGPFSSAVITVRGLGHTDVMFGTLTELNDRIGELYHLGHPATPEELDRIAQQWAPWRTWAQITVRALNDRSPATRDNVGNAAPSR